MSGVDLTHACLSVILLPGRRSVPAKLRVSWALKGTSLVHSLIVAPAALWALAYEPEM